MAVVLLVVVVVAAGTGREPRESEGESERRRDSRESAKRWCANRWPTKYETFATIGIICCVFSNLGRG